MDLTHALNGAVTRRGAVRGFVGSQRAASSVPAFSAQSRASTCKRSRASLIKKDFSSQFHLTRARATADEAEGGTATAPMNFETASKNGNPSDTAKNVEKASPAASNGKSQPPNEDDGWEAVMYEKEIPRGERVTTEIGGQSVCMLWYRSDLYAIERKSPAQGEFAIYFNDAKLTADGGIICPISGSKYNLKTGEVDEWYPDNPVMGALLPKSRPMEVFPVQIHEGVVYANPKDTNFNPENLQRMIDAADNWADKMFRQTWVKPGTEEYSDVEIGLGYKQPASQQQGIAGEGDFYQSETAPFVLGEGSDRQIDAYGDTKAVESSEDLAREQKVIDGLNFIVFGTLASVVAITAYVLQEWVLLGIFATLTAASAGLYVNRRNNPEE